MESVGENNSDWMSKLSKKLVNAPLMTIAIPGSHDSASYSLSYANDLAPDVPRKVTSSTRPLSVVSKLKIQ